MMLIFTIWGMCFHFAMTFLLHWNMCVGMHCKLQIGEHRKVWKWSRQDMRFDEFPEPAGSFQTKSNVCQFHQTTWNDGLHCVSGLVTSSPQTCQHDKWMSADILKCKWMSLNVSKHWIHTHIWLFFAQIGFWINTCFSHWANLNLDWCPKTSWNVIVVHKTSSLFRKPPWCPQTCQQSLRLSCFCQRCPLNHHHLEKLAKLDFMRNDPGEQTPFGSSAFSSKTRGNDKMETAEPVRTWRVFTKKMKEFKSLWHQLIGKWPGRLLGSTANKGAPKNCFRLFVSHMQTWEYYCWLVGSTVLHYWY